MIGDIYFMIVGSKAMTTNFSSRHGDRSPVLHTGEMPASTKNKQEQGVYKFDDGKGCRTLFYDARLNRLCQSSMENSAQPILSSLLCATVQPSNFLSCAKQARFGVAPLMIFLKVACGIGDELLHGVLPLL